jgi:hypothetical protein
LDRRQAEFTTFQANIRKEMLTGKPKFATLQPRNFLNQRLSYLYPSLSMALVLIRKALQSSSGFHAWAIAGRW